MAEDTAELRRGEVGGDGIAGADRPQMPEELTQGRMVFTTDFRLP